MELVLFDMIQPEWLHSSEKAAIEFLKRLKIAEKLARWPHGCRRQCSEVAVPPPPLLLPVKAPPMYIV
jgi:hypothetical protein